MYGSLEVATVWAEWARATGGGVRPEDDPRRLCVFRADLIVLDLRDAAVRSELGVTLDELVADWSDESPNDACLGLVHRAAELSADALIVPSAARPGGWNVAVRPAAFSKLRRTERHTSIPAPEIEQGVSGSARRSGRGRPPSRGRTGDPGRRGQA